MPQVEAVPKKRWAIWAGAYSYWTEVHPRHLANKNAPQMGGSESAALTTAVELARMGHHVLFACKTPRVERYGGDGAGELILCPPGLFPSTVFAENYDVLVAWDGESLFRYNYEHVPVRVLCYQLNHSEHPVYSHVIDLFFHPSGWHADRFNKEFGIPEDKQLTHMTNATKREWYERDPLPPRESKRVVWASSPDRGLHHLLEAWPLVIAEEPAASLDIYYDMDKWLDIIEQADGMGRQLITTDRAHVVRTRLNALRHDDNMHVTYHGGVSKQAVIDAFLGSQVLAYPCDPAAPTEGFSLTCLEAWAAGCQLVISDADALPELWGGLEGVTVLPLPIDVELLARGIVSSMRRPIQLGGREIPDRLTYNNLVARWEVEVDRCLRTKARR